jgi:hypothetical protein
LRKKEFENAKQYQYNFNTKLQITLDLFISVILIFPYKEDAFIYKLDSAYKLIAVNSIPQKMEERLKLLNQPIHH